MRYRSADRGIRHHHRGHPCLEMAGGGGGLVPALLLLSQQLKHPLLVIDFILQRQQGVPVILDACLQVRDKVIQGRLFGGEGVVCIHHVAIVQGQFYGWKHPENDYPQSYH